MPTVTAELIGRSARLNGRVRRYVVRGAEDEATAQAAAMAASPLLVDFFARTEVAADEIPDGEGLWIATVEYGMGDYSPPGNGGEPPTGATPSFAFEIGVQPTRILVPPKGGSITVFAPPDVDLAEDDVPHLIGDTFNPDEPPTGADVFAPHLEFSKTAYLSKETVDNTYIATCGDLIGTLNDAEFVGFAAERVLAIGVSGALRSLYEDWEITYRFAVGKHQTGLTVGDVTYNKKAWQYVWPITAMAGISKYRKVAQLIAVADLYETADYSGFGIGT